MPLRHLVPLGSLARRVRDWLHSGPPAPSSRQQPAVARLRLEPLEQRQMLAVDASTFNKVDDAGAQSSGTMFGAVLVRDIEAGVNTAYAAMNFNDAIGIGFSNPTENSGGTLFFTAVEGRPEAELWSLWSSDGSFSGTQPVKADVGAHFIGAVGDTVFFDAYDETHGRELWKTDGTCTGTVLVKDTRPGPSSGLRYSDPGVLLGNKLLFEADHQLWSTDGTSSGTEYVSPLGSTPVTLFNGAGYFLRGYSGVPQSLWRTDGTSAGTTLVHSAAGFAVYGVYARSELENVNGTLYFNSQGPYGQTHIWRSDGTSSGTSLAINIPYTLYGSPHAENLMNVGGTLYFTAKYEVVSYNYFGHSLWRSDGTSSGTQVVHPTTALLRHRGYDLSYAEVNGTVFFLAPGPLGYELLKTAPNSSTSTLVKDIRPGPDSSGITLLTNGAGQLFFRANDGIHGDEVWTSDGTSNGTTLVADVMPGAASSKTNAFLFSDSIEVASNTVFFSANDGQHGSELWKVVTVETTISAVNLDGKSVVNLNSSGAGTPFADNTDGLVSPIGGAYDAAGNLYVADVIAGFGTAGSVIKFNSSGAGSTFADLLDGVIAPTGVTFDASGNLYVAGYLTNQIIKVTPAGVGSVFADAADGVNRPFDVAVDPTTGNLFVTNLDSQQVLKITPAGVASVFADAADGLFAPISVAVDTGGNVYVADVLLGRVTKFNPAGVGSVFADPGDGLTSPTGMSFDENGNLFVANYLSSTITKITPAGVGSLFADAADGLNRPFDVAIGNVPVSPPPPAPPPSATSAALSVAAAPPPIIDETKPPLLAAAPPADDTKPRSVIAVAAPLTDAMAVDAAQQSSAFPTTAAIPTNNTTAATDAALSDEQMHWLALRWLDALDDGR